MSLVEQGLAAKFKGEQTVSERLFERAFSQELEAANQCDDQQIPEPSYSVIHQSAAALALRCGHFKLAVTLCERALRRNPSASNLRDELSKLHAEALDALKPAEEVDTVPDDKERALTPPFEQSSSANMFSGLPNLISKLKGSFSGPVAGDQEPLLSVSQLVALFGTLFGFWCLLNMKGWGQADATIVCLFSLINAMLIWLSFNHYKMKSRSYEVIHTDRGKEVIAALGMIRRAKSNITVLDTFGNGLPFEYKEALLSAAKHRRVPIVRIIPWNVYEDRRKTKWLSEFDDLELYRPYVISGAQEMVAMNFILIDDTEGLLFFPDRGRARDAIEVLVFRDRSLSSLMRNVVIRLITERNKAGKKVRDEQSSI